MSTGIQLEHDWFPRSLPVNLTMGDRSWWYSSFSCLHYRSERPCGITVGRDTGIYDGTFFDLGPDGEVEIGDFCTLVGVIISTNGRILIGSYAFLAHEVVLADHFAAVPPSDAKLESSPEMKRANPTIVIGQNAWIGARAVLLSGAEIGEGAIVGAAAVVDFKVAPFSIVAGNPATVVGCAIARVR